MARIVSSEFASPHASRRAAFNFIRRPSFEKSTAACYRGILEVTGKKYPKQSIGSNSKGRPFCNCRARETQAEAPPAVLADYIRVLRGLPSRQVLLTPRFGPGFMDEPEKDLLVPFRKAHRREDRSRGSDYMLSARGPTRLKISRPLGLRGRRTPVSRSPFFLAQYPG